MSLLGKLRLLVIAILLVFIVASVVSMFATRSCMGSCGHGGGAAHTAQR